MKQDAMRATGMSNDGQVGRTEFGTTDARQGGVSAEGARPGVAAGAFAAMQEADADGDPAARRFAERLSAAIDGEAPLCAGGSGVGASTFAAWTTRQKQDWSLYHLVGDALRSDDLARSHHGGWDFAARFAARLADEPVVVAPRRRDDGAWSDANGSRAAPVPGDAFRHLERGAGQRGGLGQLAGWLGGRRRMPAAAAAAAAVVTLAWALTPGWHAGTENTNAAPTTLASAGNWQRVNISGDRDLDPYLAAHQEFASDRGSLGYVAYAGAGH
ncbi:RseA family anti-sigma factor [Robbsia andropogonis]|uniref:RseA family anti-sigma factor n=2 Tax=Robbsia andropogonis TaxID=28092 RepID=UPI0004BBD488|nr:RseA family anti-sigma factor [Robbsia andropogonis]